MSGQREHRQDSRTYVCDMLCGFVVVHFYPLGLDASENGEVAWARFSAPGAARGR